MNEVVSKNILRSAVTSRSYSETLSLYNSGNGILQDKISQVFSNFLKALFLKSGSLGQMKTADKFSDRTTFAASRIEGQEEDGACSEIVCHDSLKLP